MQTYDYVKQISSYYAYWDFQESWREEDWSIDVDFEATAHAVWKWLNSQNILKRIAKFSEEWQRTEYLHLSILDYYSMFEPIVKVKQNATI